MNQVNLYEALNISQSLPVEEIQSELVQQERVWHQREINQPEKAHKMLALIDEARAAFKTEQSKAEYDQSLNSNSSETNADDTALAAYRKAKADTENFINSEQWDLAKNGIDKVLQYVETVVADDVEKAEIYELARAIYHNNGLFEQAVGFSNKAIELFPDVALCYAKKAITLCELEAQIRNGGQDASRVAKNYQTTCQIWVEKAKLAQNNKMASMGLDCLARSYLDDREYTLMNEYASEAVSLDPENTSAQEVLDYLGRTREVDLSELDLYYSKEQSPYLEDIKNLANQIVSSGITTPTSDGWILYQALTYQEDDKPWGEESERTDISIVLTASGEFKRLESWEYEKNRYKSNQERDSEKGNRSYDNYSLDLVMMAMDFKADFYKGNSDDPGHHFEHTTDVLSVSTQWERGKLIRYGSIKGKGLYAFLKKIVVQAAEQIEKQKKYEEECSQINAAYNAELEPKKAKISSDYALKRESLQREKDAAIENAKQQEAERNSILNQINAMKNELSSLGFFAGKKKKELQANIDNLSRSLAELTTVESVTSLYDKKAAELDQQEQNAFAQLETELRKKYPLPSRDN